MTAIGTFDIDGRPAREEFLRGNRSDAKAACDKSRRALGGRLSMAQCVAMAGGHTPDTGFAFIDPRESSLQCLKRMDLFLSKVQQASDAKSRCAQVDRKICLENVAHVLQKTEWFNCCDISGDSDALTLLGHFVNKLSKVKSGQGPRARIVAGAQCALSWAASRVARFGASGDVFYPPSISMLLNGLSKLPNDPACAAAGQRLARRVADDVHLRAAMNAQGVVNILNACSKWEKDRGCQAAAQALAWRVANEPKLCADMTAQGVGNSLNAVSKWEKDGGCQAAAQALAWRVANEPKLCADMSAQGVGNSLNAVSKWEKDGGCQAAARALARRVTHDSELRADMDAQAVANSLNAFSKWASNPNCQTAAQALARRVVSDSELRVAMEAQHVASSLNALGKWAQDGACSQAAAALADVVYERRDDPTDTPQFDAASLVQNIHALAQWPTDDACQRALTVGVQALGTGGRDWSEFNAMQISMLAQGMAGMGESSGDAEVRHLACSQRIDLVGYLDSRRDVLAQCSVQTIGVLLKSLKRMQQQKVMGVIADPCMTRVGQLFEQGGLRDVSLQTLGTLCSGLRPLLINDGVKGYRESALLLLNRLQPVAARKIEAHLRAIDTGEDEDLAAVPDDAAGLQEDHTALIPGVSILQVLDTFKIVQSLWKPANLPNAAQDIQVRRNELGDWLTHTLAHSLEVLEATMPQTSRNVILQIQAGDDVLNLLDLGLTGERRDKLLQQHPPTQFDLRPAFDDMSRALHAVGPQEARAPRVVIDLQGREVRGHDDGHCAMEYSWMHRLTGLQPPEVMLEPKLRVGAHLLERLIDYQGQPWRMDFSAGSRAMKGARIQPKEILAGGKRGHNFLSLVPYADSAPGTALHKLISKVAPQREDAQRLQRGLTERVAHTMVIEGLTKIGWYDDVAQGLHHPFKVHTRPDYHAGAAQRLALQPNDGCGFMRFKSAMVIPAVREGVQAWYAVHRENLAEAHQKVLDTHLGVPAQAATDAQRKLAAPHNMERALLSAQATQYLRKATPEGQHTLQALRKEMENHLQQVVASRRGVALQEVQRAWQAADAVGDGQPTAERPPQLTPQDMDKLELYSLMVSGTFRGTKLRAIPSADDDVHLPEQKSAAFQGCDGQSKAMALGRPPYDKPSLDRIDAEHVKTVAQGDVTAQCLSDGLFVIQYSLSGFEAEKGVAPDDQNIVCNKGQLMVVLPHVADWPAPDDVDLVLSKEDMKMWSKWQDKRDRSRIPAEMTLASCVRAKEILTPGMCGAIPPKEMKKRDGDHDGDDVFAYADEALVAQCAAEMDVYAQRQQGQQPTKIAKTSTSAFVDGDYRFGRAAEILRLYQGGKMLGEASTLMYQFCAQPESVQRSVSKNLVFGTYEGMDRQIKADLLDLAAQPAVSPEALTPWIHQVGEAGQRARLDESQQFFAVLAQELRAWQADLLAGEPTTGSRELPAELAEHFQQLDSAYGRSDHGVDNVRALLNNYPVRRFSPAHFPDGPPGFVKNDLPISVMNLLGNAGKAGTDAPKVDTHVEDYAFALQRFLRTLFQPDDAIRNVPYMKQLATQLRDDRFDAVRALEALEHNPTLAAGIMETAVELLVKYGAVEQPPTPLQRVAASAVDIKAAAQKLRADAVEREPRTTGALTKISQATGLELRPEHKLTSLGSLEEKLRHRMGKKQESLGQAQAKINDALRYDFVHRGEPAQMIDLYYACLEAMRRAGWRKVKVMNFFKDHTVDYCGLKLTFADPTGKLMEVQFHTDVHKNGHSQADGPEILNTYEMKEQFHDIYKQSWDMQMQGRPAAEWRQISKPAREAFRQIAIPPGVEKVEDWEYEPLPLARAPSARQQVHAQERLATQAKNNPHVQEVMAAARATEQLMTPILQPIVDQQGGRLVGADSSRGHACWLARVLKKPRSTLEKMQRIQRRDNVDEHEACQRIHDALRYEVEIDDLERFGHKASDMLRSMQARGCQLERWRDGFTELARHRQSGGHSSAAPWTLDKAPYAGLNLKMRAPDGSPFEVQMHTRQSQGLHDRGHKKYEAWRKLPPVSSLDPDEHETQLEERGNLLQQMHEWYKDVKIPAQLDELHEMCFKFQSVILSARR